MGVKRVAATKTEIVIVENDVELKLPLSVVVGKTETEIKTDLIGAKTVNTQFWVHKNRDSSIAVATGEVPDIWPEDELRNE